MTNRRKNYTFVFLKNTWKSERKRKKNLPEKKNKGLKTIQKDIKKLTQI